MNLVSRLLPVNHVVLDLDVSSKKRLFEQIGLIFENSRQIPRARVFDSLKEAVMEIGCDALVCVEIEDPGMTKGEVGESVVLMR